MREKFDKLIELRELMKVYYEEKGILEAVNKRNYQLTKIHFIVTSIDSDEAALLEILEDDL